MATPEITDPTAQAKKELLEAYAGLPEQEPGSDYATRKHILSAFALISNGKEIGYLGTAVINASGNRAEASSVALQIDILELAADYPLRRHKWLNEAQERQGGGLWAPFLKRMSELQSQPERDLELERATVEMASRFMIGSDEHGNRFLTSHYIRSDEVHESTTPRYPHKDYRERGKFEPMPREDVTGFALGYGRFTYGEWIGFKGENATRWYVTGDYIAPLDKITDISSDWDNEHQKSVQTEYKKQPLSAA